jgi:hypothetical protein
MRMVTTMISVAEPPAVEAKICDMGVVILPADVPLSQELELIGLEHGARTFAILNV